MICLFFVTQKISRNLFHQSSMLSVSPVQLNKSSDQQRWLAEQCSGLHNTSFDSGQAAMLIVS